jgi:hypothetical protein
MLYSRVHGMVVTITNAYQMHKRTIFVHLYNRPRYAGEGNAKGTRGQRLKAGARRGHTGTR